MCSKAKMVVEMKYTLRLETCVARRKGAAFKLEVHIGTSHMCGKAKMVVEMKDTSRLETRVARRKGWFLN